MHLDIGRDDGRGLRSLSRRGLCLKMARTHFKTFGGIKEMLDEVAEMLGQNVRQEICHLTRPIGFGRELIPPDNVC
jgi:hypothetical protein